MEDQHSTLFKEEQIHMESNSNNVKDPLLPMVGKTNLISSLNEFLVASKHQQKLI